MTLRGNRLEKTRLLPATVWLLEKLAESKEKQALCDKQPRRILKSLQELALIEGAESSNRIDGVTVEPERLRLLVLSDARPRDRSEEEILGYRNALSWVHGNHGKVSIEPEILRRLHALAQEGTVGDAGALYSSGQINFGRTSRRARLSDLEKAPFNPSQCCQERF